MARGTPFAFRSFAAGTNIPGSPHALSEGYADDPNGRGMECMYSNNVTTDPASGRLRPRRGNIYVTSAGAINGAKDLSVINQGGGGNIALVTSFDRTAYSVNESGTVTNLGSIGSRSGAFQWLRLPALGGQGPIYGMDGTDAKYVNATGTTMGTWTAASGTLPVGTMMVYANNRLWVSGVAGSPYSVYFSEVGDPRTWPVQNVVQFSPEDGLPVTALQVCGPYLLVFKANSISKIYDLDTGANTRVTSEAGTLAARGCVPVSDSCYFVDPLRGVMVTDATNVRQIGANILPAIDGDNLRLRFSGGSTGAFVGGRLYMSITGQGQGVALGAFNVNTWNYGKYAASTWEYVPETGAWFQHDSTFSLCAFDNSSSQTKSQLFGLVGVGSYTTPVIASLHGVGQAKNLQSLNDGANPVTAYWQGPFHAFGSPSSHKRIRRVAFEGTGTMSVSAQFDYQIHSSLLPGESSAQNLTPPSGVYSTPYSTVLALGEDNIYNLGTCRAVSLYLTATGGDWELDGYTIYVDQRKD